jgi:hypothetical protein
MKKAMLVNLLNKQTREGLNESINGLLIATGKDLGASRED